MCRSLSEQLGLHFLTVSRDSRATLRAVYEPRDGMRVYETHGDLLFCGAEQVVRTVDRERDGFDVAILDVSRVDDIDDAARALLSGMSATLRAQGKVGYLVDPDGIVIRTEPEFEAIRFSIVEDAVAAAERSLRKGFAALVGAPAHIRPASRAGSVRRGRAASPCRPMSNAPFRLRWRWRRSPTRRPGDRAPSWTARTTARPR